MGRFLLGVLVGGFATASFLAGQNRPRPGSGSGRASPLTEGRVDELSAAAHNPAASPLNAGDGTPGRSALGAQDPVMPPRETRH